MYALVIAVKATNINYLITSKPSYSIHIYIHVIPFFCILDMSALDHTRHLCFQYSAALVLLSQKQTGNQGAVWASLLVLHPEC